MCATMPAYAIGRYRSFLPQVPFTIYLRFLPGFFIAIILRTMGWGVRDSLLLSAPPYVFAVRLNFFLYLPFLLQPC